MSKPDHTLNSAIQEGYELQKDQTVHELKVWPAYFKALDERTKRFEVRKNDRDFKVGDVLWLREYDWNKDIIADRYTGRYMYLEITYILPGGQFGIEPGHVVMGLSDCE